MRPLIAILKKEVLCLLGGPWAFGLLGFWFLLNGLFFVYLLDHSPGVQDDLGLLPNYLFGSGLLVWLLLPAFPPLLTLALFAEEHRTGSLESLLTAPVRDGVIVAGKFLAAAFFFLLFWGGVLVLFFILQSQGALLDWPRIFAGFLGALCVSFLFLATGLWASSWGGNLILAAGGGAAANYCLLFLPVLFEGAPGFAGIWAQAFHVPNMLDRNFSAGIIDSYSLVFFISLTLFFLFLTWLRLAARRLVP